MPKPVISKTWFEIQDNKINAKLDKIIGQLEALQASIDGIDKEQRGELAEREGSGLETR